MNKEQKCISLSLAKELQQVAKEKDFKLPESEYMWSEQIQKIITREWFLVQDPYNQDKLQDDGFRQAVEETYNLYDTSELGEILPSRIAIKGNNNHYLQLEKTPFEEFEVLYQQKTGEILGGDPADGRNNGNNKTKSKTEANARVKMLIYLIKNNLIK